MGSESSNLGQNGVWALVQTMSPHHTFRDFQSDKKIQREALQENAAWLLLVAAMWGATNPFIKRGSRGVEEVKADNAVMQFIQEFQFLFFNIKYLVPFLINQIGSVVYYITLSSAELSLAVPITNSLTFLFTSLAGRVVGEKPESWETCCGLVLVMCGVILCVYSKSA